MITREQLLYIMPFAERRIPIYLDALNDAMHEFDIDLSAIRESAFIAQLAHESGQFRYVQEIASGQAYEGRKDLGNTEPGDGIRFKGRGLIQITGRSNYETCGNALNLDLINHPELLEQPVAACRSAGWFWQTHGLNELADHNQFRTITKRINGGLNGIQDREHYYQVAKQVLGVEDA